ncbi:response regulator transcription factor [Tellurirhabdus bombi]|uniref:response regulator transcription factor n=1 Tax=Tellurirhabdus bombi TaxID=2907205 RepID=UPI001F378698|nr:LytTR family transcriptional regulator DNA-binding domain-containing protein [Tellurirhabdus bombi]
MSTINEIFEYPSLVSYLSGASNYSWVYFRDGRKTLISKPISYFEARLPQFLRIHKTALINPTCIDHLENPPRPKMAGKMYLFDGTVLPVSRRRWNDITALLRSQALVELPVENTLSDQPPQGSSTIIAVMDSAEDFVLLQKMAEKKWPNYTLLPFQNGSVLPRVLQTNPADDLPVLVILDARTEKTDRMITLRALKSDPRLCVIPVVLLVNQDTKQEVEQGYEWQANSIIALGKVSSLLVQAVDETLYYWLNMASLPPLVMT